MKKQVLDLFALTAQARSTDAIGCPSIALQHSAFDLLPSERIFSLAKIMSAFVITNERIAFPANPNVSSCNVIVDQSGGGVPIDEACDPILGL